MRRTCSCHCAWLAYTAGSKWLRHDDASARSKAERAMRTASTRSCPGLVAQPERYIIQVNEGLIQVMRSSENGATKVPAATAASAMSGRNAW